MNEPVPDSPASAPKTGAKGGESRRPRSIRFSDSEWEAVEGAARTLGMTPAGFVRERILGLIRNDPDAAGGAVPASLAPLIERTFRYAWFVATVKRDEMFAEGRSEEIDSLVKEARELQNTIQRSMSE